MTVGKTPLNGYNLNSRAQPSCVGCYQNGNSCRSCLPSTISMWRLVSALHRPDPLPAHLIGFKAEAARHHLNTSVECFAEEVSIGGIRAVTRGKRGHIRSAEAGHQDGSCVREHMHQFLQVFLPSLGHGVGEQGKFPIGPGGVFHLDVDRAWVSGGFRWL